MPGRLVGGRGNPSMHCGASRICSNDTLAYLRPVNKRCAARLIFPLAAIRNGPFPHQVAVLRPTVLGAFALPVPARAPLRCGPERAYPRVPRRLAAGRRIPALPQRQVGPGVAFTVSASVLGFPADGP